VWQTRSGADAMAVEAAGALLLAVAVSDAFGFAAASFYLLVLGVPMTAVAGLACFARVVDASRGGNGEPLGRLQVLLGAVLVLTIVIGAAIRAPVVPEGVVPGLASGALAFSFAVLVLQALLALAPTRRERV
jgi:uncharacterized membrane protein